MSTTPEEAEDLQKLRHEIEKEKHAVWDYCKELLRMDQVQLGNCGHRNGNAQAIHDTFKRSVEKVEKLVKAHVRKYPDEGMGRKG